MPGIFNAFLEMTTEYDYCVVRKLAHVMRNPENVFLAAYNSETMSRLVIKPVLGHKVQGVLDRTTVSCNGEEEGQQLIWDQIKKYLDKLSAENINFDDIVIIPSVLLGDSLQNFLFQKCEEYGIPAGKAKADDGYTDISIEYTSAAQKNLKQNGTLMIYPLGEVTSMEWPIVIYADYQISGSPRTDDYRLEDQHNYLVRSRATAKLIEIIAEDADDDGSSDDSSDT